MFNSVQYVIVNNQVNMEVNIYYRHKQYPYIHYLILYKGLFEKWRFLHHSTLCISHILAHYYRSLFCIINLESIDAKKKPRKNENDKKIYLLEKFNIFTTRKGHRTVIDWIFLDVVENFYHFILIYIS